MRWRCHRIFFYYYSPRCLYLNYRWVQEKGLLSVHSLCLHYLTIPLHKNQLSERFSGNHLYQITEQAKSAIFCIIFVVFIYVLWIIWLLTPSFAEVVHGSNNCSLILALAYIALQVCSIFASLMQSSWFFKTRAKMKTHCTISFLEVIKEAGII